MPVYLNGNPSSRIKSAHKKRTGRNSKAGFNGPTGPCLNIGLINNMPDRALEATERQFINLLDSSADGVDVSLSLYMLPDVPRNDAGRLHVKRRYSGIENLWTSKLDGLIVTGREPSTPSLTDEPYYGTLTKVLEWARENTHSTIWSCLAAHAAILHLDGIERRRGNEKRCGLFDCVRVSDHQLMTGVPATVRMPHSRWNDIEESDLTSHGYSLLTRVQNAGADTFVKREDSLFVFFQGHPEYESDTLWTEYVRDVGRYLRGNSDIYPSVPYAYFDKNVVDELEAFSQKARSDRREELLTDIVAAVGRNKPPSPWRKTAIRVYGNWLKYLNLERKQHRSRPGVGAKGRIEMALPGV